MRSCGPSWTPSPRPNRKLVTFHDAFPYLAAALRVCSSSVSYSGTWARSRRRQSWRALVDKVRAAGVRAVFSEAQFNPELAQTLAEEAGVRHVVSNLYTRRPGAPPADSYLGLMRYDIEQIASRAPMTDGPRPSPWRMSRPDTATVWRSTMSAGGRRRVAAGRGRPQRRRQEHAAQGDGRTAAARVGHGHGPRRARRPVLRAGSRICPRRRRSTGSSRWP